MRFAGIFNRNGGTFRTLDMDDFCARAREIVASAGASLDCRVVAGEDLINALRQAAADPNIDVILAGGGDGTISAAAAVCFETGKPLAVLPAGTMNLFARALRVPPDLEEALWEIANGRLYRVDIATANGRPFVHQYSVGLHARLVRIRESIRYENRWGKMLASLRAVAGAVAKDLRFTVQLATPHGRERHVLSGVSVSNNPLGEGHAPHSDFVDTGLLGLYLARPMTAWEAVRLIIQLVIGRWKAHPRVSERLERNVVLTFPRRKPTARAVIDGELVPLPDKVVFEIHPRSLAVYAPRALSSIITLGQPDRRERREDPALLQQNGVV